MDRSTTDRSSEPAPSARPLTQLGAKSVLTDAQLDNPRSILKAFPNPRPGRDYQIFYEAVTNRILDNLV